jgi:hypothetical protein
VIVPETATAIDADPVSSRPRDVGVRKLNIRSAHDYSIQPGQSFSSMDGKSLLHVLPWHCWRIGVLFANLERDRIEPRAT